ncbi:MAG TPA: hypothetical protein VGO67_21695 [Verrucomicrobiae bacterium]|jgi:hypothetical protein
MLELFAEFILGSLTDLFLGFVWWILLFPVIWLASLPFILVFALFERERYGYAVGRMILNVHWFWSEWGLMLTL